MGADASFFYLGVRYVLQSDDELEAVESQADERVRRAKRHRLKTALVRLTDGEPHVLLIGAELAVVGVENDGYIELSEADLTRVAADTRRKLLDAGFTQEPTYHLQLSAQY